MAFYLTKVPAPLLALSPNLQENSYLDLATLPLHPPPLAKGDLATVIQTHSSAAPFACHTQTGSYLPQAA